MKSHMVVAFWFQNAILYGDYGGLCQNQIWEIALWDIIKCAHYANVFQNEFF